MFKNSKTPAENYTYEFISDAITTNDVELIRQKIYLAMNKFRIQRNSVVFECQKSQKVIGYEKTREQLLNFLVLKEKFEQKMETKQEEEQKFTFKGNPKTLSDK